MDTKQAKNARVAWMLSGLLKERKVSGKRSVENTEGSLRMPIEVRVDGGGGGGEGGKEDMAPYSSCDT
ncbi:hypothetical protein P691DRAFT_808128 [Macrolepiota fuliginosa MF-IS2]|uniref:Uncharacterized protein n=1 Tax=Macrolepiota fuliginosa MF-IS2 TaxID=1400762 RepID=A0A9P5X6Y0_9AGAR|nr:hypothetical protein P691DRAFT_808128 [Macrolepiota fuliginosa MF-IS2]